MNRGADSAAYPLHRTTVFEFRREGQYYRSESGTADHSGRKQSIAQRS